ncbi:hypothetical protein CL618_00265 [archaeon]|nr:hypothetical protein [archaeon]|tara:strand:- start:1661 stop:2461 length:801 start_codon:yes stop_codon:yes gene_type:complete
MNKIQKQIIKELKQTAKQLKKSPTRRQVPKLNNKCIKHFTSFNKAKERSGLKTTNNKFPIPKKSYILDKNLTRIISYLTFDGHLYKDLRGFYLSSKNFKILKDFKDTTYKKFNLKGTYQRGTGYGESYKYRIFNLKAGKLLNRLGTPNGDKMLIKFDIPEWIKKDKKLSREYLRIAFLCEGSKYKHSKNTERIKFNLNKTEELLDEGLNFIESIKLLLKQFNIETTNTRITKSNKRKKDGKITKSMIFQIRSNSFDKFIKEIGWFK